MEALKKDNYLHRVLLERSLLFLFGAGCIGLYGARVCPFIESLETSVLARDLSVVFLALFVSNSVIFFCVEQKLTHFKKFGFFRPWISLFYDLSTWILFGLGYIVWNYMNYEFPLVLSGAKILISFAILGLFTATYNSLVLKNRILKAGLMTWLPPVGRFTFMASVSIKFFVFIATSGAAIGLCLALLIFKDFSILALQMSEMAQNQPRLATSHPVETPPAMAKKQMMAKKQSSPIESITRAPASARDFGFGLFTSPVPGVHFRGIFLEIIFVFVVFGIYSFLLVHQFLSNLRLMFRSQIDVLQSIEREKYDHSVPVVSHDEFGLIATKTNSLISRLKDKKRIQALFGKFISPFVAESILSKGNAALGGEEKLVTVLFVDIRNYTPLSEQVSSKELVTLLNSYFSFVVRIAQSNSGVVDKFMGDAAMIVFGLDDSKNSSELAVKTAQEIREEMTLFNQALQEKGLPLLDNGFGINYGKVIAGNIGSDNRMEYTVIGETVNTASRLEGLTKELPLPIAFSEEVYKTLPAPLRSEAQYMGVFQLKGVSKETPVYALAG